jgi:hypothetical protein
MTRSKFLAALVLLSAVSVTPALAQAVVQDPGAVVQTYAGAEPAHGPVRSQVWPAPVGHRQPRGVDVLGISGNTNQLDDSVIDSRIVICRGC